MEGTGTQRHTNQTVQCSLGDSRLLLLPALVPKTNLSSEDTGLLQRLVLSFWGSLRRGGRWGSVGRRGENVSLALEGRRPRGALA